MNGFRVSEFKMYAILSGVMNFWVDMSRYTSLPRLIVVVMRSVSMSESWSGTKTCNLLTPPSDASDKESLTHCNETYSEDGNMHAKDFRLGADERSGLSKARCDSLQARAVCMFLKFVPRVSVEQVEKVPLCHEPGTCFVVRAMAR